MEKGGGQKHYGRKNKSFIQKANKIRRIDCARNWWRAAKYYTFFHPKMGAEGMTGRGV